jgi:hypothetical protein
MVAWMTSSTHLESGYSVDQGLSNSIFFKFERLQSWTCRFTGWGNWRVCCWLMRLVVCFEQLSSLASSMHFSQLQVAIQPGLLMHMTV